MNEMDYYKAISSKRITEHAANELAYIHICGKDYIEVKGGIIRSVLPILKREIRHASVQTYSNNFLPVSASFTILDQLGFCYSRNDIDEYPDPDNNASGIKKALYYFCGLKANDKDTKAIVGLRNSFLHSASCAAKSMYNKPPHFHFIFDRTSSELLIHPTTDWNGDFTSLNESKMTVINPIKLIDIVENAVACAYQCLLEGSLVISLEQGPAEMFHRFLKFDAR